MVETIKKIIKKIIGEYTYSRVKRLINKRISRKSLIQTNYPLKVITEKWHTSGGYYDHNLVQADKLLYISTDRDLKSIVICCRNLNTDSNVGLIASKIVNWQQGNRLFWIGDNRYIFNDFDGTRYVSKENDNGLIKVHPWPVYDANEKIAISIDFSRLGYLRPGYGYTELPFVNINEESIAIEIYNIKDDSKLYEVRYQDILSALGKSVDINHCYINHVRISPKGDKFLFFFIEKKELLHMCYLGIWKQGEIVFLEKELSASHYTWQDNDHILVTAYDKNRKCGYYLYDVSDKSRKNVLPDLLVEDGHPTFLSRTVFVTDTYPDVAGFQKIIVINTEKEEFEIVLEIYSTAKHMGVKRCDLHPRYDLENKIIYFDADVDGHRRLYALDVEEQKWIKKDGQEGS